MGSSQRELAIAKQCCLELSKTVATAEKGLGAGGFEGALLEACHNEKGSEVGI